jgi:hypothetical protein
MTTQKNLDIIENTQFILTGRLSANEHFVEGFTQMFIGFPHTKVLFHTVLEPKGEDSPEIRKASQLMTIPTVTAIEFAHLVLTAAKNFEEQIISNLDDDSKNKIKACLQNVLPNTVVAGFQQREVPMTPNADKASKEQPKTSLKKLLKK